MVVVRVLAAIKMNTMVRLRQLESEQSERGEFKRSL